MRRGHRLVDRVCGEQVPGRDGVALADAVAAVLGLVVHRGRPLQLEERDVGRARQRDALPGDARRSDQQLRPAGLLEGPHRGLARGDASRGRGGAAASGKRSQDRLLHLDVAREDDERLAGGQEVVDPGQRRVQLAARGQALQRAELRQALGAQRRGDAARSSSERSSGCSRSHAMTSSSARRYSRSLSSATGTTTWRLAGSWGSTSDFSRRTKQRRRRCQCRRSSLSWPRNSLARSARPSRSPPGGR